MLQEHAIYTLLLSSGLKYSLSFVFFLVIYGEGDIEAGRNKKIESKNKKRKKGKKRK
jgi:hypothetical protein